MNITIYTKSNCPNCQATKQLLDIKRLQYRVIDVETPEGRIKMLANVDAQYRQMPQVFIDGQRVGGLAGLQAALNQLRLI